MNVRRNAVLAVSVAVGVVLLGAAIASAALPKPTRALVVPFKSIGPIAFGTSKATAFQKWGQGMCAHEDTTGQDTCAWLAEGTPDFPPEGAALQLKNGKVCGMLIRAGTNLNDGTLTITRLKNWDTKDGIGLGSRMRKAKTLLGGKTVKRKNGVTTALSPGTTDSTRNKLEAIHIYKDGCQVT
jgi:hypothetical protein